MTGDSTANRAPLQHGTQPPGPPPEIPNYQMLRCIGSGSYGEVWLAQDVMPIFYSEKSLGVLGKGVTKTQFARWHYISCLPAIFLRGLLLRISGWFTRSPVL